MIFFLACFITLQIKWLILLWETDLICSRSFTTTLKQKNFHGFFLANLLGSIINGVTFLYKLTIAIGFFGGRKPKIMFILQILWNSEAENILVIFYGSHILCFIHKAFKILKTEKKNKCQSLGLVLKQTLCLYHNAYPSLILVEVVPRFELSFL